MIALSTIRQHTIRGFSLIEATVSIGIAATAIVTILGLVGSTATHIGDADRKTTQARISRELIGEVSLSEWSSIPDYHHQTYRYDAEGTRIDEADEAEYSFFAYLARIEISEDSESETSDDSDAPEKEPLSRKVTVKITNNPFPEYDFDNPERRQHATFSTWVAKMDRQL